MAIESFNDVLAFVYVVREGSFTRAAAMLGVSPSAISHAIRGLEDRLGARLLIRTTRSIATSEEGERLFTSVAPLFEDIDAEVAAVRELRDKPMGTIRITATEHAVNTLLWPKLAKIMKGYPDIKIEITIDYTKTDIVSQHFDAGVRLGHQVAKDMIAVRIGPDLRNAVVGSPEYFAERSLPLTPQALTQHNCINLRLPPHGALFTWDFSKDHQKVKPRVEGQWLFNNSSSIVRAALAGYGLAFIPEDLAMEHIATGKLIRVLDDWCAPYPGYHLYYTNRREYSRALTIVVEALRYNEQ